MTWEYSEDRLIEQTAMKLFYEQLEWDTAIAFNKEQYGELSPWGRKDRRDVLLNHIVDEKLRELNLGLPEEAYSKAIDKLMEESITKSLEEINYEKHQMLRDGIAIDYTDHKGELVRNKRLRMFDLDDVENNNFLVVRQMWFEGKSKRQRRPDIIGFVNGIPLLFVELKAAHRKLESAYNDNFVDYKDVIPRLFYYNAFVVLSNGIESRIGSITGKYQYFHEWKRITEEDDGIVGLDRIILGLCQKERFMDMFENFVLFDSSRGKLAKIIARNHQFIGVNKAYDNIKEKEELYKVGKISLEEKQRLGVFWHTQGSGKSYSMVFLAQKVHRKFTGSYTFLIVTDRNELDKQIYGTFGSIGAVPIVKVGSRNALQASSGENLKTLLQSDNRYLFTLIHKFNFEDEITQRDNIIVISDEAHRTQGGQLAMNMRKALPNASFIGFTGTPLFKDDELTRRIFGDYVSRYDFKRSVDDGATVPLYYENRGDHLGINNPQINKEMRAVFDAESDDLDSDQISRVEQLFAREYPILTAKRRLRAVAKDMVRHFFDRGYKGKGMFIAIDKLTAVRMYNYISEERDRYVVELEKELKREAYGDQEYLEKVRELDWIKETEICVVVSSEQGEIQKFNKWGLDIEPHREKMNNQDLESRFKDENDPFRLVIVCAMWITGFDVPSLSTLYIDKPLKAHTLMQAIARANRINEGKNNGLIVDYIETYTALLGALAIYGSSEGGSGGEIEPPVKPKEELIEELEEAIEATELFLRNEVGFDLNEIIEAEELQKIAAIDRGVNSVYTNDDTKNKFMVLAREVFKKFKALQPEKELYLYKYRKNAIDVIYKNIENNVVSADVSEIMLKMQEVVDRSIASIAAEPYAIKDVQGKSQPIDVSGLNFEVLEKYFIKAKNKKTAVQSLKQRVEAQLQKMVSLNPMKVDFYNRYQDIIDRYNKGKDDEIVYNTFMDLIELVNSLTEDQVDTKREGLTDEQKAVFDILRYGKNLKPSEYNKVKEISIELLNVLKSDSLRVDLWSEKNATSAAVFRTVGDTLFQTLPHPTYENEDIEVKTNLVFQHLRNQYYGAGRSVYGSF